MNNKIKTSKVLSMAAKMRSKYDGYIGGKYRVFIFVSAATIIKENNCLMIELLN